MTREVPGQLDAQTARVNAIADGVYGDASFIPVCGSLTRLKSGMCKAENKFPTHRQCHAASKYQRQNILQASSRLHQLREKNPRASSRLHQLQEKNPRASNRLHQLQRQAPKIPEGMQNHHSQASWSRFWEAYSDGLAKRGRSGRYLPQISGKPPLNFSVCLAFPAILSFP